ncbi:hypothetical protein HMPREF0281_00696 [Corynebacterium ammoniagenes DSM 20306]|uniref:Uncharacterized protein n=1 Tax=Corynebacterium ammoniagenes DSM 20306 TaxID=649754 RepID=A0ABN0AGK6_CORAM|nr:hypothetical protein HMPREF0281_00696 [Corynebacterium ammoniagenes DSM 20306]
MRTLGFVFCKALAPESPKPQSRGVNLALSPGNFMSISLQSRVPREFATARR